MYYTYYLVVVLTITLCMYKLGQLVSGGNKNLVVPHLQRQLELSNLCTLALSTISYKGLMFLCV